jgi:hypothetical protein
VADKDEPTDPITAAQGNAAQTHELFDSYVAAGFTRPEALDLVSALMSTALRFNLENPNASS